MRRETAGQVEAMPEGLYARAQALRAAGECAAASKHLEQAICHGHLTSRADLADGREGVAQDQFAQVNEGATTAAKG